MNTKTESMNEKAFQGVNLEGEAEGSKIVVRTIKGGSSLTGLITNSECKTQKRQ